MHRRSFRPHTLLLLGLATLAGGALAAPPREERAHLAAAPTRTADAPGTTATVQALMKIEDGWHTNSHKPTFEYLIGTEVTATVPAGWPAARVAYPEGVKRTFSFESQPLSVYEGTTAIPIAIDVPAGTPAGPRPIEVKLRYQACSDRICLPPVTTTATATITVGNDGKPIPGVDASTPGTSGGAATPSPARRGILAILALAVLGGLILNAMPCVLPVLSLKVFGLVRSAGAGHAEIARGALATSAGIVLSFIALAGAAVGARSAGAAIGWGIQFQNAGFVAFLAAVVLLFCLNLWGLFEIPLPERLARFADARQGGEGVGGHFASGLFATLMATPCSAPFLGSAVGFALGQTAPVIFAVFLAVGIGMSLPYLLLAAVPSAASILPKPGEWMNTFKGLMGFLLAGAAVWLFYVLAAQVDATRVALVELLLLAMGLCAWMLHRAALGSPARTVWGFGILLCALAAPFLATRGGAANAAGAKLAAAETKHLIDWQPWDRASAERLAAEGRVVFVDVTAEWCFTCKVNERLVLETPEMAALFKKLNVAALRADWTNRNDTISEYLAQHDRYGIPFYLVYRPDRPPTVLPELLTRDNVLAALPTAP
jgi:suppressor for copper-sensitivity B